MSTNHIAYINYVTQRPRTIIKLCTNITANKQQWLLKKKTVLKNRRTNRVFSILLVAWPAFNEVLVGWNI